ncbi:coil containing protein [Vibrio phage 1.007.O._10N.261.55.F9]|nr:coil containing protein [Vibrio phage 1.007.O._10N.261.55.F9]
MKEVIEKLERILELTSTHGITLQPENKPATSEDQLMYVESKIRLNAIQALDIFDKNNIEKNKPRTKAGFVKCEYGDKVSNIVMDFESNVPLYKLINDEHWTIDELDDLFQLILNDCYIYRKVETEIDERQEFIESVGSLCDEMDIDMGKINWIAKTLYDSGKFKLVE